MAAQDAGPLPLQAKRILITRPAEAAEAFAAPLRAAGAQPIVYPTIDIAPPSSWQPLDESLQRRPFFDWVIFTSGNAVRGVLSRPLVLDVLRQASLAAVGGATARVLADHGLEAAIVPEDERQEGLFAAFAHIATPSAILFPQAVDGRAWLTDQLRSRGFEVHVVPVSRTLPRRSWPALPLFDVATFASPSALKAYVQRWGAQSLLGCTVAVIGPTTKEAALAAGVSVHVTPDKPNPAALVEALTRFFSHQNA